MTVDAAIIGGTGTGEKLLALPGQVVHVPTECGVVRGKVIEAEGKSIFVLSRHSAGHKIPPHKVNYHAMTYAARSLGVKACLATAAVGSLRREWGAGTLVACSDFIDVSGRFPTLFDRKVFHTDFSDPFPGRSALLRAGIDLGAPIQDHGIYVCSNGPRYDTPHEVKMFTELGGDLIGMTAASEAILMREAGIPYGCLAIVTNLACGLSDMPLNHEEVVVEMEHSGDLALKILTKAVSYL